MWGSGLTDFFTTSCMFDGVWLNYNEPQNDNPPPVNSSSSIYQDLPFVPGNRSLSTGGLNIDSVLHIDDASSVHSYDLHLLYGTKMAQVTHRWMAN